jgi:hypothetical protein
MKHTRLKFTSAIYLIAFRRYAKASSWEIALSNLTVLCNCPLKEVRVACRDFGAQIVESSAVSKNEMFTNEKESVLHFGNRISDDKMSAVV